MKALGMIFLVSFLVGLASIKVALALFFLVTCVLVFYWVCSAIFSKIEPHSVNKSVYTSDEETENVHMVPGNIGVSRNEDVVYKYDDAVKGRTLY